MEVEKYFKTNFLNSADVFKSLCHAQEELLLVMQQEENTVTVGCLAEVLGFYKELVEACLVDD